MSGRVITGALIGGGLLFAGLLLASFAADAVRAQPAGPPAAVEDCLKQLRGLVDEAHAIVLLDDQIEQAETLISRMVAHCLASEFSLAASAGGELRQILATNK